MFDYFLLAIFWSCYFALHSFMASKKMKALAKRNLNGYFKFYRLTFNFISIILLFLILFFQFSLKSEYLYKANFITMALGIVLFLSGIIAMFFAFKAFNTKEFTGLEQLEDKIQSSKNDIQLTKSGFYGLVRHPLYFATILLIIGAFIFMPTISNAIFVLIVFVYLPMGVYLEEQKLINEFGQQYLDYQNEVKAVIPFLF